VNPEKNSVKYAEQLSYCGTASDVVFGIFLSPFSPVFALINNIRKNVDSLLYDDSFITDPTIYRWLVLKTIILTPLSVLVFYPFYVGALMFNTLFFSTHLVVKPKTIADNSLDIGNPFYYAIRYDVFEFDSIEIKKEVEVKEPTSGRRHQKLQDDKNINISDKQYMEWSKIKSSGFLFIRTFSARLQTARSGQGVPIVEYSLNDLPALKTRRPVTGGKDPIWTDEFLPFPIPHQNPFSEKNAQYVLVIHFKYT